MFRNVNVKLCSVSLVLMVAVVVEVDVLEIWKETEPSTKYTIRFTFLASEWVSLT